MLYPLAQEPPDMRHLLVLLEGRLIPVKLIKHSHQPDSSSRWTTYASVPGSDDRISSSVSAVKASKASSWPAETLNRTTKP